jgi:hypothetical protein
MNLTMIRGDSRRFAFPLTDAAGEPLDLTDCTITMTAKSAYTDSDAIAVFAKTDTNGITVATDPTTGIIVVELESGDTSSLDSRIQRLVYDIQVQKSTGEVSTPVRGRLTVYPDVTTTIVEVS